MLSWDTVPVLAGNPPGMSMYPCLAIALGPLPFWSSFREVGRVFTNCSKIHAIFAASCVTQTAKLKWLQNCVLAVDPTEPTIRMHLPVVLRQLKGALTASNPIISQRGGTDVSVVRLTTHVVNSLASMLPPARAEGV